MGVDNDRAVLYDVRNSAKIIMGSGDDVLRVDGDFYTDEVVEMGDGFDIIFIGDAHDDYLFSNTANGLRVYIDGDSSHDFTVTGVEHIKFGDGKTYEISSGTFIDGIVEGLQYTTSSCITGLTDANGDFTYFKGDE
ncbi:MAG: hypothetical protein U9N49_10460, partial [Campylobacterota bacterium]|nr:hypothetical protein [Campylobacterota bacterium]